MAVIAAYNLVDKLVLLEDGRELPITNFYVRHDGGPLKATDQLLKEHRTDCADIADVFTVEIPGADAALIVEIGAITDAKARNIN